MYRKGGDGVEDIVRAGNAHVGAIGYVVQAAEANANAIRTLELFKKREQRQFQTRDPTRPTRRDEIYILIYI